MPMTPEGKVKERVKKVLTERGAFWYMPMGTAIYSRKGIPDFLVCYKGYFISIETKAGNNKPSKLQEYEMDNIFRALGTTLVINETNLQDIIHVLEVIDNENRPPTFRNFRSS